MLSMFHLIPNADVDLRVSHWICVYMQKLCVWNGREETGPDCAEPISGKSRQDKWEEMYLLELIESGTL